VAKKKEKGRVCRQVAAGIPDGCEGVSREGGSRVNKGYAYGNCCERNKHSWVEGCRGIAFVDRPGGLGQGKASGVLEWSNSGGWRRVGVVLNPNSLAQTKDRSARAVVSPPLIRAKEAVRSGARPSLVGLSRLPTPR